MGQPPDKLKEASNHLKRARACLLMLFLQARSDVNNIEADAPALEELLKVCSRIEKMRMDVDVLAIPAGLEQ